MCFVVLDEQTQQLVRYRLHYLSFCLLQTTKIPRCNKSKKTQKWRCIEEWRKMKKFKKKKDEEQKKKKKKTGLHV